MDPFKPRLLAALILVVSLAALRMGLAHAQPHGPLFWLVTAAFALQAAACAAYLLTAVWRAVRMRRTVEQK